MTTIASAKKTATPIPGGFAGKLLRVDMTKGTCWAEPWTAEEMRDCLGGIGLGSRILYRETAKKGGKGNVAWDDPQNRLVLATGPVDVFGRSWQIHTMLGFVALTLIGAQVIQLGVFARTYALVRIGEHDPLLDRLGGRIRLEHGLLVGGGLVVLAIAGLIAVGVEWASEGFETLGRAYETALLATMLGLGIQIVFGAFFLALLVMPLRRDST